MSAGESSYPSAFPINATATMAIDGNNTVRTPTFLQPFKINMLIAYMVTAYTGATASVITCNREKEGGTATNDVEVGTFTIPVTAVLGDIFYLDVRTLGDTFLAPGESWNFISDGGADATTTVQFGVVGYYVPEGPYPFLSFTTVDKPRSGTGDIKYLAFTET